MNILTKVILFIGGLVGLLRSVREIVELFI